MDQLLPLKSEYASDLPPGDNSFGGFKNLNSTPIPDEFFDVLAVQLSEAELRVLLYIMRRTFGFKKKADAISLSQLTGGIRKRDGSMLDYGTGLSRPSVLKAVSGLQTKGIITIEKRTGEDGRNEVNVYQLRFADDAAATPNPPVIGKPTHSTVEQSTIGYTQPLAPDPRFVSARPQPAPEKSSDRYGGQRQAGETFSTTPKMNGETGVNQVNRGSKVGLPGVKTNPGMGKAALPGGVNQIDRGSQIEATGRVNQLNLQHGSLQESRRQPTETQAVLQAKGALAYNLESSNNEELYINEQELARALLELGLSEKLAFDLIQVYPAEYLWEKINLTRQQLGGQSHQRLVKNAAGYLRRAIQEDYRPVPARKPRPETSNFADRFPGAMAYLQKGQAAQYTLPLEEDTLIEEDFYQEDAAPLPPIYRQSNFSPARSGESLYGKPPTPPMPGRARNALTSGGAERTSEFSRPPSYTNAPPPDNSLNDLWEKIFEDLEGRFRLGESLDLLRGAQLFLPAPGELENCVTVLLAGPWQERALSMAARSAIALAIRQRLGPGFKVTFASA